MADDVLYEVADGVARLTINRPEKRNALELGCARRRSGPGVAAARIDPEVRVVVLTGAGDVAFCAGADLTGMRGDEGYAGVHDARGELARLFDELWHLGKPTIARVRGYCLAGGFGLALSCDLVVAADDATFGTPEINVGLWPYMITVPLCRSMPPKRALELMMTGRRIDAAEAERFGFLTRLVASGGARRGGRRAGRRVGLEVAVGHAARPRQLSRGVGHGGRRRPPPPPPDAHGHDRARGRPPRASRPSPRSEPRAGPGADRRRRMARGPSAGGSDRPAVGRALHARGSMTSKSAIVQGVERGEVGVVPSVVRGAAERQLRWAPVSTDDRAVRP